MSYTGHAYAVTCSSWTAGQSTHRGKHTSVIVDLLVSVGALLNVRSLMPCCVEARLESGVPIEPLGAGLRFECCIIVQLTLKSSSSY